MRALLRLLILTGALSTPMVYASSSTQGADKSADTAAISEVLKQNFPEVKIDNITQSPLKDIYQVSAGAMVLYVSKDGHYAISGDIIDLKNAQQNLTEQVRKQARLKGLKNLKAEDMIVFSPKNPKHTITVFTDIDCGYCRQLQSEMAKINELGIAIRYLAFPRGGPQTPTFEKMAEVWCAKDKKQAIAAAKQGKPIQSKECNNGSVLRDFQYGMALGVTGTPTLLFEDGSLFPGYLPPEKLLEVAQLLAKKP